MPLIMSLVVFFSDRQPGHRLLEVGSQSVAVFSWFCRLVSSAW